VTNATDVKPLLTVATYLDTNTGIEVYQEVTGALYCAGAVASARSTLCVFCVYIVQAGLAAEACCKLGTHLPEGDLLEEEPSVL
jgi:hypothetical protein